MDSLQFDLELATSKAERQFKAFVSKLEGDMKKLKKEMEGAMSPKRTGGSSGKGEQDRAVRELKRSVSRLKKEISDSNRETEKFFGNIGKAARKAKKEQDDALRSFKRAVTGSQKSASGGDKDPLMESIKKIAREDKKMMDNIASARIVAMSRIDNATVLSNDIRLKLAQALENDLVKLEANRVGKTKEILQAELVAVAQANASRVKDAKSSAAQDVRNQLQQVTRMNKANMVMFGVQQSIEDFQFAGFRGVSNNLAMMTSMMGGGTGLAAMAALAAVNLGTMAYSLTDAGQAADQAATRTQKLIDKYMHLRDVRQGLSRGNAGADPLGIAEGSNESRQKAREVRREMRDALANRNRDLDVVRKIKEAREAAKNVSGSEFLVGAGSPDSDRTMRAIENRERLKNILDQLSQATGGSVKSLKDLDSAEKSFGDSADAASQKASELAAQARNLVNLGMEEDRLRRFVDTLKEFNEIDLSGFGDFGDASGNRAISNLADKFRDKMSKGYEQSVIDRKAIDDRSLENLQEKYTDALDSQNFGEAANILDQIEEIYRQQVKDLETLRDKNQDLANSENERLTRIAMVADKEREVRSELKSQIALTKKRIAQQEEVIANLEKQKQASRENHEADKFGLQMNNIKRDADEQAKAIESRAKSMRDRIKGMMAADQNNPFLSPMHKAASQAYGEAWLRKIDRDEKKMMDQAKQKRLNRERKAYDQRESGLSTRAAAEFKKAQDAAGAGEFGKAESWLQKQRQTLEELRRLQMDQAMNLERRGEANAAGGRADKTQGEIDASFDKEMEMARQKQQQEQAQLQQMQASLEELNRMKQRLQDTDVISHTDIAQADAALARLQQMLDLKTQIANTQLGADSPAGAAGVPQRAAGGPVTGGSTYLVGENGPELFTAGSTGRIYNTNDTRGLMGMVSSIIASGEHGGRQAVHNNTNFGTTNVNVMGGASVQDLLRQSAMAAKQARIRQS